MTGLRVLAAGDAGKQGQPLVYVNPAFCALLGLPNGQLLQAHLADLLLGGELVRSDVANLEQALGHASEALVELPFKGPDGACLWVEVRLSPMGQAGSTKHIVGECRDITRRKEGALLAEVCQQALEGMTEAAWIGDAAGRLSYVNQAFCALTGYAAGDCLGRCWDILQGPGTDPACVQRIAAAIAAGRPCHEEMLCHTRGDDRVLWVQLHVSPIAAGEGAGEAGPQQQQQQQQQHVAIFADISARKSCSTTAQLCEQALASTSEGILITDPTQPDNPIVYANAAFERLTGYSREEVVGRNCRFLQGPDSDPVAVAELAEAGAELRPVVVEVVNYKKDGTPFWNQVSVTPILDARGAVVSFVAVQQDVSERRAAEEALRMRDKALSNLSEGITIADPSLPDCPIVYCNDAFLKITGYSREEVVGRNSRWLQGPDTDPAAVDRLRTAVKEGREVTVELLNYRKGGEPFTNLLSITPVRDGDGRLTSIIGVQSDITDLIRRRQVERELQEAKAAAEIAAEAKSLFLANMSHEIRTPLNGMIVGAQLLQTTPLNPEQRRVVSPELLDTLLESSNTLLTILGDILDFSKIEQHSLALELSPVCLRETLEASIEQVAGDAQRKGLELAYLLDPPLAQAPVLGDSIRMRQVLVVLLANAVKFTDAGEVVLAVTVEQPAQGGGTQGKGRPRIHFAVRDTGIGISPEVRHKLFTGFRQGHESMSRKYGGIGLGLAISRRLAELMGGTVWVESQQGVGSTFHFTMVLDWASPRDLPAAGKGLGGRGLAAVQAPGSPATSPPAAAAAAAAPSGAAAATCTCSQQAAAAALPAAASGWPRTHNPQPQAASEAPGVASAPAAAGELAGPGPCASGGDPQWAAVEWHRQQRSAAAAAASALSSRSLTSTLAAPGTPSEAADTAAGPLLLREVGPSGSAALREAARYLAHHTSSGTSFSGGLTAAGSLRSGVSLRGAGAGTSCGNESYHRARTTLGSDAPLSRSSHDTLRSRNSSEQCLPFAVPLVPGLAPGALLALPNARMPRVAETGGPVFNPVLGFPPAQASTSAPVGAIGGTAAPGAAMPDSRAAAEGPQPRVSHFLSSLYSSSGPDVPSQPSGQHPSSDQQASRGANPRPPAAAAPTDAQQSQKDAGHVRFSAESGSQSMDDSAAVTEAEASAGPSRGTDSLEGSASVQSSGSSSGAGPPYVGAGLCQAMPGLSEGELAQLRGKTVAVAVAHQPTAVQIQQSCHALGMAASIVDPSVFDAAAPSAGVATAAATAGGTDGSSSSCSAGPASVGGWGALDGASLGGTSESVKGSAHHPGSGEICAAASAAAAADFCIISSRAALGAIRSGWRGRPVVAVGCRDDMPLGIHPLVAVTPRPVRHTRLVAALLKASALVQHPLERVPLLTGHPGASSQLLSLLPERQRLQSLQVAGGRVSLDNSLLVNTYAKARAARPQPMSPPREDGAAHPALQPLWRPGSSSLTAAASGSTALASGSRQLPAGLPSLPEGAPAAAGLAGSALPSMASIDAAIEQQRLVAAAAASQEGGGSSRRTSQESQRSEGDYPPLRILIAEDNLINQKVIKKVLQRVLPSSCPDVACNGLEALDAVARKRYDLVLMDIHMPEMDGLEASRQIQARLPREQRPVIVALSADTLQSLHERCRDAGIVEFISKPFRVEDVKRVLQLVQRSVQVGA
ncbi:hypothetical protein N2152v2_004763 [Parachlorella kessleri]